MKSLNLRALIQNIEDLRLFLEGRGEDTDETTNVADCLRSGESVMQPLVNDSYFLEMSDLKAKRLELSFKIASTIELPELFETDEFHWQVVRPYRHSEVLAMTKNGTVTHTVLSYKHTTVDQQGNKVTKQVEKHLPIVPDDNLYRELHLVKAKAKITRDESSTLIVDLAGKDVVLYIYDVILDIHTTEWSYLELLTNSPLETDF